VPTVLRVRGYRLFFYSGDRIEPPHVHVESADGEAKYWLEPVSLAWAAGYSERELLSIGRLIQEHRERLLSAWYGYFGH